MEVQKSAKKCMFIFSIKAATRSFIHSLSMNPTTTTITATVTTNTIKEQQQSQSKKSILDKLYDPCTVCRYESILNNVSSSGSSSSSSTNNNENIDTKVTVERRKNQSHRNESSSSSLRLNQNESMCLSTIPWNIKMVGKEDCQNKTSNSNNQSSTIQYYPPWNYLGIRHDQNMNWAQNQLEKGVHYAKEALQQEQQQKGQQYQHSTESLLQKAEHCYKQGLDLIPHHIGLLTAYSALCINDNRLVEAKKMLGDVLIDQQNINSHNNGSADTDAAVLKDAKLYLKVVEKKLQEEMQQKVKDSNRYLTSNRNDHNSSSRAEKIALSNRSEHAYQNALMERSILLQGDNEDNNTNNNIARATIPRTSSGLKLQHMQPDVLRVGENRTMKKYELVYSSSSSAERIDSDDESHEQQSYNSRRKQSESKRRRKPSHSSRHKKRKKRRKKHHNDESSYVDSHIKKQKKEKKHRR